MSVIYKYDKDEKEYVRECPDKHLNSINSRFCNKCGKKLDDCDEFKLAFTPCNPPDIRKIPFDDAIKFVWPIDNLTFIAKTDTGKIYEVEFTNSINSLPNIPYVLNGFHFGNIEEVYDKNCIYFNDGNNCHQIYKNYLSDSIVAQNGQKVEELYVKSLKKLKTGMCKIIGNFRKGIILQNGSTLEFVGSKESYDSSILKATDNYNYNHSESYFCVFSKKNVAVYNRNTSVIVFECEMPDQVSKIEVTSEYIVVLLQNGDVYILDPKINNSKSKQKIDSLSDVRDIHLIEKNLFAVNDTSVTIIDIYTEKSKSIQGKFKAELNWIVDNYFVAIEEPGQYNTINLYDYSKPTIPRAPKIDLIDGARINKIFYADLFLNTLILNYGADDGKKYFAVINL